MWGSIVSMGPSRTTGATVNVALVALDVLAVDWVGVLSPSELCLSFSRLHAQGLLSVSYPSSSS